MFSFKISAADILSHNAESGEVKTGAKENRSDNPAGGTFEHAAKSEHRHNEHGDYRKSAGEHAAEKDKDDGLYAEGSYAVPGKVEHFSKAVFAFAGKALSSFVIDFVAFETEHRHHSAKEKIDFIKVGKGFKSFFAHKAVIRMIEDYVGAEKLHEFIIAFGGEALHEFVGASFVAHAVNDFAAAVIFFYHFVHGVDIVLKVGINGNRGIAKFF